MAERPLPSMLVVDDDERFRQRIARALATRGFDVRAAGDASEALALAHQDSPEFAVVDLRMPGGDGLQLVTELKRIDQATRVIVLTGYGSIASAVEAIKLGATHYLAKPADADEILAAFGEAARAEARPGADEDHTPSLARAEWEHINRILLDCQGNVSEAARRLGIHRRSLQRKLAKYAPS
ncbi:MAG: response regulator [Deltaproteobacteria bacterium]|nr:response regulator [Deltaproteobacteria bacterium]